MGAGKLVHRETGDVVNIGDKLIANDGHEVILQGWRKPHKPSSTGRVFVKSETDTFELQFFPSVFNLEIIDYEG